MSKYQLECRIAELEKTIMLYDSYIEDNKKDIYQLEEAYDITDSYKNQATTELSQKYDSFSFLESVQSKKIMGLAMHMKSVCSEQNILDVLSNYEGICNTILQKIDDLTEENHSYRNSIIGFEDEINSCRSRIEELEEEEREKEREALDGGLNCI